MASTIKSVTTTGFKAALLPTQGFLSSSAPPPSDPPLSTGGGSTGGGKIRIYSKRRLKRPFSVRFR